MANLGRMADSGALLCAGPFMHGGDWRGIFIFRAESVAKLRAMVAQDPAVESGRLHPHQGSASAAGLHRPR